MFTRARTSAAAAFVAVVSFCCWPIWWTEQFINQDGTPHLYNAYLMTELVKGNSAIAQFARLNTEIIPNVADHWILALLLPIFGPAVATKVIVTLLFACVVAAAVWLRFATVGTSDVMVTTLFAAVIAFNWPWFLGFYNFTLGTAAFAFTLGLWWRWRSEITLGRTIILALLFALTFFCHLACFAALAGAVTLLTVWEISTLPRRSLVASVVIVLIPLPFAVSFMAKRMAASSVVADWNYKSGTGTSIFDHVFAADPFALVSRQTLPFTETQSPWFALLSPLTLVTIAAACMIVATFRTGIDRTTKWLVLAAICFAAWVFGPDVTASGALLRERTFILGAMCLVPFFRYAGHYRIRAAVISLLGLILIAQVAALVEFTIKTRLVAMAYAAAAPQIGNTDRLGSVVFLSQNNKFRTRPETNLSTYLGIGKEGAVWDNYELGYDVFSVIGSVEERTFVTRWHNTANIYADDPHDMAAKLSEVRRILEQEHDRFDVLLVWNEQPALAETVSDWFETTPYFTTNDLKLYRHRR